jgi:hypothetical protein
MGRIELFFLFADGEGKLDLSGNRQQSQQPDEQKLTNSHRSLLMCALASYTPGTEIEKEL